MSVLTDARQAVGGLSKPSKMPGYAYSIPASKCNVGSKLKLIPGSVCFNCYADRGRYLFSNVQNALNRRLATISDPAWSANMATAINGQPEFRWHDSGDIQSIDHLHKIVEVCRATPNTKHWLPTREKRIVKQFLRGNTFPDNLCVRISATMIDGPAPVVISDWNRKQNTSTVHNNKPAQGYQCPAPSQGNKCQNCRACWDRDISNISYGKH